MMPVRVHDRDSCRMCGSYALTAVGDVGGYAFVECSRCAFCFAPAITQETMARLYRSGYHGPGEGVPEDGWANTEFLGPVLDELRSGQRLRILDFGTGQSHVPETLRAWGHRVIAVDVAPPVCPHPDRFTGDLRTLGLDPEQFDLIYTFQVFEHLPEPLPYLQELLRLTKPGGRILIHTDMEVPERDGGFTEWWYVLPPDHCSFFRHRTFEVFTGRGPWELGWRDPKTVVLESA